MRWSFHYDMWCKMEFFGAAIEDAMNEPINGNGRVPGRRNLLESLPDEFSYQDAVRVRQAEGINGLTGITLQSLQLIIIKN